MCTVTGKATRGEEPGGGKGEGAVVCVGVGVGVGVLWVWGWVTVGASARSHHIKFCCYINFGGNRRSTSDRRKMTRRR
jgi:hypothetical protein